MSAPSVWVSLFLSSGRDYIPSLGQSAVSVWSYISREPVGLPPSLFLPSSACISLLAPDTVLIIVAAWVCEILPCEALSLLLHWLHSEGPWKFQQVTALTLTPIPGIVWPGIGHHFFSFPWKSALQYPSTSYLIQAKAICDFTWTPECNQGLYLRNLPSLPFFPANTLLRQLLY